MILGLSPLLSFHVAVSLVAILSGFVVVIGLIRAERMPGWTAFFLATTILTSLTGLPLPADRFLPSHLFAILSLIALAIALAALYGRRLARAWRPTYVIAALTALYLNVFVLVVQIFGKVPGINRLAPTQSEPPFLIAQLVVLAMFLWMGFASLRKFRAVA